MTAIFACAICIWPAIEYGAPLKMSDARRTALLTKMAKLSRFPLPGWQ
jgi:hypothetical protein